MDQLVAISQATPAARSSPRSSGARARTARSRPPGAPYARPRAEIPRSGRRGSPTARQCPAPRCPPAARPRRAPDDAKAPIPTPGFYNDAADSKRPRAYFSFFALAPLTLAVPRSVFCRFLRCLPARGVSTLLCCNGNEIWLDGIDAGSRRACRGLGPRTLLSAGALGLGGHANADQAVVGLELLHGLGGVVDQGEAGGLAATELGSQAEDLDLVLLGLVHATELLAELLLGDVGTAGVEDVTEAESAACSSIL